jgi:hypothetical protein
MFQNRIKKAWNKAEIKRSKDRRVPKTAAFVILPTACIPAGFVPWIYQLAYEQAQAAAAAEPHFELPAFSAN